MPNKTELDHMVDEYIFWYSQYGNNYKAVGWNKPKQIMRFESLLRFWDNLLLNNTHTIIDLGCGLGHLAEYLEEKYTSYHYTGIDINSQFIRLNKQKFAQHSFFNETADNFKNEADIIIASGLFNRKFTDSKEFYLNTLFKMINNSYLGCSFNCLSSKAIKKNDKNFYISLYDVESVIDRTLLDGFVIDGNSIPGEITVHLRKKL